MSSLMNNDPDDMSVDEDSITENIKSPRHHMMVVDRTRKLIRLCSLTSGKLSF